MRVFFVGTYLATAWADSTSCSAICFLSLGRRFSAVAGGDLPLKLLEHVQADYDVIGQYLGNTLEQIGIGVTHALQ